jgi:hypothetical protein
MTQVTTGKVRLSYPHLFEPKARDPKKPDEKKYSAMLMIPKSDTATMDRIWAAEEAAKQEGKSSKWGGKIPGNLKPSIIKDGDDTSEDYPERAGHWTMSVSSNNQPGVVDRNVQPIIKESDIYAGCYVRAALNAAPYNFEGNKGVTFFLNHIQKWEDGEPLGGVTRAEDVFEAIEDLI